MYCRWRVGVRGTGENEPKLGLSGEEGGGLEVFENRGGENEVVSMKLIAGWDSLQSPSVMVVVTVAAKSWTRLWPELKYVM